MSKKLKPSSRPSNDPEPPPASPAPRESCARLRGLPSAAYTDPVEAWKVEALTAVSGGRPRRGITLSVQPGFLLAVMLAGAPLGVTGWAAALLTLLSVVLVQELPRVLSAYAGRRTARVVISAAGGATEISGPAPRPLNGGLLSLLGSVGNIGVALGLGYLMHRGIAGRAEPLLSAAAATHALWGLGQALPLTPFRAGHAVARWLKPDLRFAHAVWSFACVLALGLWALRSPALPVYFSIFVLATLGATSAIRNAFDALRDQQSGVDLLAAQAAAQLRDDQPESAAELARRGLATAAVESTRARLWHALAWAAIGKRDPFTAHAALAQLKPDVMDVHLVAAYLACCNRASEAMALLQEAREQGQRSRETSKLLVDLLFQADRPGEALALLEADRALLAAEDLVAMESALVGARDASAGPALVVGRREASNPLSAQ